MRTADKNMEDSNARKYPDAILAEGHTISRDTRRTGLNNNVLVLGPSGSGKTRHVLKPNLLQMGSGFLVLDTKGTLCREVGPLLAQHGYDVQRVNFADLTESVRGREDDPQAVGYNPLTRIRRDHKTGLPNQQDILSVSKAICPTEIANDPFWDNAAANYLSCCIAYTLEELPEHERHLGSAVRLAEELATGGLERLMGELEITRPGSYALSLWRRVKIMLNADKNHSTVMLVLFEKLMCLAFDAALELYTMGRQVDFARMGHERAALFVTVSDVDHSLDPLTSLFVTQAIRELVREADHSPGGRLPVPVHLLLDDFSNLTIPDFVDAIAVQRSREIWCTVLLQTVSQLERRYGRAGAQAIVGNCDSQLVLGFQDMETASWYADRANRPASSLLETPLENSWLFVRGRTGKEVRRYQIEWHPLYEEMLDAQEHTFAAAEMGPLIA